MPRDEAFSQRLRLGRLADIYGGLLTEKQRLCLELYFGDDLSLGEISQELGVSRQAVHDLIRRVGQLLEHYEEALGVSAREEGRRESLDKAIALLEKENDGGRLDEAVALLTGLRNEGR